MPKKRITQDGKTRKRKITAKRDNFIECKDIKKMFKKKTISGIAKTTGFIRRQRKLDVYEFFFFDLWIPEGRHHEFKRLG